MPVKIPWHVRRARCTRCRALVALVAVSTVVVPPGPSAAAPSDNSHPGTTSAGGSGLSLREELGDDYMVSTDVVVHGRPDAGGYRLFKARKSEGWSWRLLATVRPDAVDVVDWTGYHCVTGDGRFVIAVVGPRSFVNNPVTRDRGGLAYVVDMATGAVAPLADEVALKYHTPGCGASHDVALISHLGTDQEATTVRVFDAAERSERSRHQLSGQLTSAVPSDGGIIGARDKAVVRIGPDGVERAFNVDGLPFSVRAHPRGADFLTAGASDAVRIWALRGDAVRAVGAGALGRTRLFAGRGGNNLAVDPTALPRSSDLVRVTSGPGATAVVGLSMEGTAVLRARPRAGSAGTFPELRRSGDGRLLPRQVPRVGDAATATPFASSAPEASDGGFTIADHSPGGPGCAVPRNHVRRQVPQPNAARVNWAIQQATRNLLTSTVLTRPPDYANMGLVAYQPSNDFPRRQLLPAASSVPVPPSVIQAVFAQESNWRHASPRALPGVAGNPNVGDFYGNGRTLDHIDLANADCGYGVSQVTDPMTADSHLYSFNGKTKVAVDYAENVAAGIQFLVDKWNQLQGETVLMNNNDPSILENWYAAIWAYNSGYNSPDAAGREGLGWTNNPMNADWDPARRPFLRTTYADAERPGDWPYQERVFGWMETPQLDYKGNQAYDPPLWSAGGTGMNIPHRTTFCTSHNSCDVSHLNGDLSYCTLADRHCWWHQSVTFAGCPTACATSRFTYSTAATEPANDDNYPPNCNRLPQPSSLGPTVIVDNQPDNLNVEGCTRSGWAQGGTFAFTYGRDGAGVPLGEIDWHQLGTGFGGHVWFTKNRPAADTAHVNTGTWSPTGLSGAYSVKAHVPPSGASTSTARYTVHFGNGLSRQVVVDQHLHENRWVSLGVFDLGPGAKVDLTNVTSDTVPGSANVAFDAMAFTPVEAVGVPVERLVDALSIFDSEQDVDTASPTFVANDNPMRDEATLEAWARDKADAVITRSMCLGRESSDCVMPHTYVAFTRWREEVDRTRAAQWLAYSNPDPPGVLTDAFLGDPDNYKLHNRVRVFYRKTATGIDPASVAVSFVPIAGYAKVPPFILRMVEAVEQDYGIDPPDMTYTAENLGTYSHRDSTVDPFAAGDVPGRAFNFWSTTSVTSGCISVRAVGGGTNGWKPMLNEGAVAGRFEAWKDQVGLAADSGRLPASVYDAADKVFKYFFSAQYSVGPPDPRPEYEGAPARWAPPIWIQQNFKICADDRLSPPAAGEPIAYESYMPDLYVYVDGRPVNAIGGPMTGPAPIEAGDFEMFSNDPNALSDPPSGFGICDVFTTDYRSGNPWNMGIFDKETRGDNVGACDDHFSQTSH